MAFYYIKSFFVKPTKIEQEEWDMIENQKEEEKIILNNFSIIENYDKTEPKLELELELEPNKLDLETNKLDLETNKLELEPNIEPHENTKPQYSFMQDFIDIINSMIIDEKYEEKFEFDIFNLF
jgi:hypothetical protein